MRVRSQLACTKNNRLGRSLIFHVKHGYTYQETIHSIGIIQHHLQSLEEIQNTKLGSKLIIVTLINKNAKYLWNAILISVFLYAKIVYSV